MAEISIPSRVRPLLDVLRSAYPDGVPRRDYIPLIEHLQWFMSEQSLAIIVAALINGDPASVASDSAVRAALPAGATQGMEKDIWRVRKRLDASGWDALARDFVTRDLHARISHSVDPGAAGFSRIGRSCARHRQAAIRGSRPTARLAAATTY